MPDRLNPNADAWHKQFGQSPIIVDDLPEQQTMTDQQAAEQQKWLEEARSRLVVGEVRVTDPKTGGQKGQKLARFDLLPGDALEAVAEHFGKGALKYEDRNWEKGVAWSLSFAALQRHVWSFWQGDDIDEETGDLHIQAVAWHALVLLAFALRGAGTDDRPKTSAVH